MATTGKERSKKKYSKKPKDKKCYVSIKDIAKNDGLSWDDFKSWFGEIKYGSEFVIIHFTDFRYLNSFAKINYSKQHFNYEKEN